MNWLTNVVRPKIRSILKRETPENLWIKCPDSGQLVFYKDVEANQFVIPGSNYHMRMGAAARLKSDLRQTRPGTISRCPDVTADPLKFRRRAKICRPHQGCACQDRDERCGSRSASASLKAPASWSRCRISISWVARSAWAAGEAIVRGMELAVEKKSPFIMFAASGGARMQEGILSLMQMPRSTVGVQMLREAKLPYIVVLTNPTTGRGHRVLRDARRRADCRARRADRFRRRARDRTDHSRKIAGRFPARRISARPRHGRHGGASPRHALDPGTSLSPADQIAGDRGRLQAGASVITDPAQIVPAPEAVPAAPHA